MIRKLAGWAVLAFALFYAITNPTDTADFVRTVASGLAQFASALAGGGTQ
ncbi:hypothetical protein [Micromonospora sp. CPCC 206061]